MRPTLSLRSPNSIPVFTTIRQLRSWRTAARDRNEGVGFVPTMGALHQGHLDLVKKSLETSPRTVLSIFVNPSQFSPTEDLSTYPRTLPNDLSLLSSLVEKSRDGSSQASAARASSSDESSAPLVVFAPSAGEMYPNGITTVVSDQKGAFVEVKKYGDVMEGKIRPGFFRGVATVVTKLFNIVQPDVAHFGQKDIQQALLLRTMLRDLHFTHPSPSNLYIHPTTRAPPPSNLALSSRNAYLSPAELLSAPILHRALSAAVRLAQTDPEATGGQIKRAAEEVIEEEGRRTEGLVEMEYVEVFRPDTFEGVKEEERVEVGSGEGEGWVIAGAMRCGRTRLIDNLVTGMEFGNGQEKGI